MRIDGVHKYFKSLLPEKSKVYKDFYSRMWQAEDYPSHSKEEAKIE